MPTVVELRNLAKKHSVKLPYNASKEIILKRLKTEKVNIMENHKEPEESKQAHLKPEPKHHLNPEPKPVEPPPAASKSAKRGETRNFQVAPDRWEALTREEAEEKGFFWGDIDPTQIGRTLSQKSPPGHESAK